MKKGLFQHLLGALMMVCLVVPFVSNAQIRTIENNRVCNDPIAGSNIVISNQSGSLLSLGLLTNPQNIISGNTDNFATATLNVSVLGNATIAGVRDTTQYYPAGNRVGFVIGESTGLLGLLSAGVLNNLRLETYRNGTLQESASVGGANPIQLGALGSSSSTSKQILSFITTADFDEVRLTTVGAVTAGLSTLLIYYAFEEPSSCLLDCTDALAGSGFTQTSASSGICLNPLPANPVDNAGNTVDGDTTNFATISTFLGISCSGRIRVTSPVIYPGGYEAGFVIANGSGLLSANVLNNITISTFLGAVARETRTGASLAAINLLNGTGPKKIGFKTSQSFDRIEITVSSAVGVATTTNIYYAYVVPDADGDGIPDCRDTCPFASISDTDGDGIFDACDSNTASISVTKTSNASEPAALNDQVTFSITARKDSLTATGLVIQDTFTAGLSYVSHVAPVGTNYNPTTGVWTVGSALSDPTVNQLILTIVAKVDSVGISANVATITAINETNFSADTGSSACVTVPYIICEGQGIQLSAPAGLTSYQWFNGANPIAGATDSTFIATQTGIYQFNGSTPSGCASGNCCPVYVTVNPKPVAAITGDTLICGNGNTTLTASGGTSYLWSTGATTASITVSPTFTTSYFVIATNGSGCSDTAFVNISVAPTIQANMIAVCSDNNTSGDSSDDTFTFTLNPAGGSGTTYSISGAVTASGLSYGTQYTSTSFLITGGALSITLTDDLTGCTQTVTITPPAACSACPTKVCVPIGVRVITR